MGEDDQSWVGLQGVCGDPEEEQAMLTADQIIKSILFRQGLRYPRCLDHDECRADPEMGRLCAADQEMRRHASTCPRCELLSPCEDWVEVDHGVGVQRFDRGWMCPRCGRFGLNHANEIVFECDDNDDDDAASSGA
jgi:ribosomal protein S27AE